MKALNVKNSELYWGFLILLMGLLIFVVVTNALRYLGIVFLVAGIIYFIRIFSSKPRQSGDDNLKSKTRDQVYKYQNKR